MPRKITVYKCACCEKMSENHREIFVHEAKEHFHLSVEEYKEYKNKSELFGELRLKFNKWKHTQYLGEEIKASFDKAKEDLATFEKEHNLNPYENPFL